MGLDDRPTKKRKTKNVVLSEASSKHSKSSISPPAKVKASLSKKLSKPVASGHDSLTNGEEITNQTNKRLIVVAGSYERVLYGLEIEPCSRVTEDTADFTPVFAFPAHISCVKAVAASPHGGKWLATGGTDETVKVWDLRRKKELGSLQQHQGSITRLSFPTRTHLLSAAEDGTICLYHTRDWTVLATLKGHRDRVNDLAVHPSAKVCLSVGKDRTLRMWDLMIGKGSASVKLGKEGEGICWAPSGTRFTVFSGSGIDIYSTKMSLLQTVNHPSRIHDIFLGRTPSDREVLMVAAEDRQVTLYLLPTVEEGDEHHIPPVIGYLSGHKNRVKALAVPASQDSTYVTTVSSDGLIHLYDLTAVFAASDEGKPLNLAPIAVYDTKGSRLTCVAVTEIVEECLKPKKRKHSSDSDIESVEVKSEDEE